MVQPFMAALCIWMNNHSPMPTKIDPNQCGHMAKCPFYVIFAAAAIKSMSALLKIGFIPSVLKKYSYFVKFMKQD